MMNNYKYGYPKKCSKCEGLSKNKLDLHVLPYSQVGSDFKIMFIGQDPTIFQKPGRVKKVLMLDDPNSQLSRWLKEVLGRKFEALTLYATNLVKCSFDKPPSTNKGGGLKFLKPYFRNCKKYLTEEIKGFAPNLILTFGEPAHKLFIELITGDTTSMKDAFTGGFIALRFGEIKFDYSPCLHIKTFRVADVYGNSVKKFKESIRLILAHNPGDAIPDGRLRSTELSGLRDRHE
jgi:uracil-DNA glycosylase